MANDVITHEPPNLLAQAADELGGGSLGKILKFTKGKYFVGDDEVAINTEMIAHVTQLARGRVKFKNGELVNRCIGKVVDGFKVPPREQLDEFDDKSGWEKNERGEPRDLWVEQSYLPLEHPQTSELIVFVTGSSSGFGAVGALIGVTSRNLHKGQPIIQLAVRSYKHKQFGRIENPNIPIVGWIGGGVHVAQVPALAPTKHPAFDDQIPL
jgi:hypothetical protein